MADKNNYTPDIDAVRRALSALLTQDPDTKKLFEEGSRTYFKLFGGDINNFINLNSNLIQASILLKILDTLEKIEQRLSTNNPCENTYNRNSCNNKEQPNVNEQIAEEDAIDDNEEESIDDSAWKEFQNISDDELEWRKHHR
jgi:hypothetical protein